MIRIGQGYDVHRLVPGRKCIIGGVEIPNKYGLLGHSDADVLLHALTDAILGALGKGDIGRHFPDTDPSFKDADSKQLLAQVWELAKAEGYELGNADCTVIAEQPKMGPYIAPICDVIASLLDTHSTNINVKASTNERIGFIGREEGIAALAVVMLHKKLEAE